MTGQIEHLVSVGIPVYNRAELLDRRLANVVGQTHKNLEIIVSDNASPDPHVAMVAQKYAKLDSRIQYVRQESNIEAWPNFAFVLRKSCGKYFVWAADDDEWDEDFIEVCVAGIGNAQLFMPNMAVIHHKTGAIVTTPAPPLSIEDSPAVNLSQFFKYMQPGLVYGLHDRIALLEIFDNNEYDMSDVGLVLRAILSKGVQTGDGAEYRAGIPGDEYSPKAIGARKDIGQFSYRTFLRTALSEISTSPKLSIIEKILLGSRLTRVTLKLMAHLAVTYPSTAAPHHKVYSFLRRTPVRLYRALVLRRK